MEEHISTEIPNRSVGGNAADAGVNSPARVETATASRPRKTRARIIQIVSILVLVVLLVVLWRFLGDRAATPGAGRSGRGEVVPVEVASVTQQDVPIQIKSIGNVEAQSTVGLRSQVEGILLRVGFVPGQEVKKGDLLFMI